MTWLLHWLETHIMSYRVFFMSELWKHSIRILCAGTAWDFDLNFTLLKALDREFIYKISARNPRDPKTVFFLIFYGGFKPREVSRWIRTAFFMQIHTFRPQFHHSGPKTPQISWKFQKWKMTLLAFDLAFTLTGNTYYELPGVFYEWIVKAQHSHFMRRYRMGLWFKFHAAEGAWSGVYI